MRVCSLAGPVASLVIVAGCGSSGAAHVPKARMVQKVAYSAGATTCVATGYHLMTRAIYDCQFATGPDKCVTYEGGIADDATEDVRFAFSTAGSKPTCLSGLRFEGSRG
jgi:hypothetical protein